MCGIAGRFHAVLLPPDPEWQARADRLLAHRGPDGHGRYRDDRCELVHRRLALLDLAPTGAQPMTNEDRQLWVVFNGEIYNHRELRANLERRGHTFRSTSDTEVLLHLYEELGPDLVSRLRGMFAFALYDRRAQLLLLARDRYGIKPLFYTVVNEQIVFASEIKAILALSGCAPQLDRQACYDFLGLSYVPEPATGFVGIHALAKGTTLVCGGRGRRHHTFATVRPAPQEREPLGQVTARLEAALLQAVGGQSVADVPVAALLSGGIDSSLVVAAYCRTAGEPPRTFNVRFPDRAFDETRQARAVASHYHTQHQTIDLDERAVTPEAVLDLIRHFDQPFADSSLIPMYYVCQAIRDQGIICTMSGDGGDEAFGGYAPFWRLEQVTRLLDAPAWAVAALGVAGQLSAALAPQTARRISKAALLARAGRRNSAFIMDGLSNYLLEADKQALVRPEARRSLADISRCYNHHEPPAVCDLQELSARLTESFFALSLPGDMLRKVDMMSMRAGIEVRVPLLDEDVVALGLDLVHRLKTDGRQGKLVLRALAGRWLPPAVAQHRKQGFSIPLDQMARPAFHTMLADLLLAPDSRSRAFLEPRIVETWLRLFRDAPQGYHARHVSRGTLYQRVFILLSLECWLRTYRLTW